MSAWCLSVASRYLRLTPFVRYCAALAGSESRPGTREPVHGAPPRRPCRGWPRPATRSPPAPRISWSLFVLISLAVAVWPARHVAFAAIASMRLVPRSLRFMASAFCAAGCGPTAQRVGTNGRTNRRVSPGCVKRRTATHAGSETECHFNAALGVSPQLRWRREHRAKQTNQRIKPIKANTAERTRPCGWFRIAGRGHPRHGRRGGAPWTGSRVPGQRSGINRVSAFAFVCWASSRRGY